MVSRRNPRQQSSTSTSRLAAACLCLLVAATATSSSGVYALPSSGGENRRDLDLVQRQLASSADAAGDTIVYSVTTDDTGAATTTTIETIPAGGAATTTAADAAATTAATSTTGNAAVGAGAATGPSTPSINLGQQTASPTATGSQAPPTTYIAYSTANGQQITLTMTFVASTPSTPPPTAPLTGTVLAYTAYVPSSTSTTGAASTNKKFSRQNGQVAAFGVLLSMLVGAIVVL